MPQAAWFTVEFTFHSGHSLPVADVHNLSSDPFIEAVVTCNDLPDYKDDPPLLWRTPTVRHTREPVWDSRWRVSGIPASGLHLAMKLKDEDARDRDDRLGKAYLDLTRDQMRDGFELVHHKAVVMKRKGSVVPYIATYLTAMLPGQHLVLHPRIELSVKVVAMEGDPPLDRPYTIGPNKYSRHFSPLIGRVVLDSQGAKNEKNPKAKQIATSSFTANKLQLSGPVPSKLRHRFVPYRPFIDWLFLKSGPWGWILNAGLHKQYRTVYSYDKNTEYGIVCSTNGPIQDIPPTPVVSMDMASTFLKMTNHGEGERIFTYVITLDGEWRFCETGEEFAIDLLSKHSMHADVAKEVAFSGEFFVRKKAAHHSHHQGAQQNGDAGDAGPPPDSKEYELIIDNDSGTYRPKKELLPTLQEWLSRPENLGSLGDVSAMDGFDEKLKTWKSERKAAKHDLKKGKVKLVRSGSSISSLSSSELGGGGSISSEDIEDAVRSHEERLGQPSKVEAK